MSKRLIDIDDKVLETAQAQLGTPTIKATVNEALRLVSAQNDSDVSKALDVLARMEPRDRGDAWR